MRFSGLSIGGPGGAGAIVVTPQSFTVWVPGNISNTLASTNAIESILNQLAVGNVYGASIVGTAAAANKAIAELNNPAASGKAVYVYSLDFFVPAAMAINVLTDGTTLAPVGTGVSLKIGAAAGVAKVGGGNQLAPTGALFYTSPSLAINADYAVPQPWLISIPAGHNMQLQGQTVNQAFTCNVRWYELNN